MRSKAIHQMSSTSLWWRHLVNAYEVTATWRRLFLAACSLG